MATLGVLLLALAIFVIYIALTIFVGALGIALSFADIIIAGLLIYWIVNKFVIKKK